MNIEAKLNWIHSSAQNVQTVLFQSFFSVCSETYTTFNTLNCLSKSNVITYPGAEPFRKTLLMKKKMDSRLIFLALVFTNRKSFDIVSMSFCFRISCYVREVRISNTFFVIALPWKARVNTLCKYNYFWFFCRFLYLYERAFYVYTLTYMYVYTFIYVLNHEYMNIKPRIRNVLYKSILSICIFW